MIARRPKTILASLVALTAIVAGLVARPAAAAPTALAPTFGEHRATAVFAGGCFWGMEDVFAKLRGVSNVVVGYSGGARDTAMYDVVSEGTTGHAESVDIAYDPTKISYEKLLDVYFSVAHDPTELNRQGPDEGTQYRSAIFYANGAQKRAALRTIASLTARHAFPEPIVTQVVPLRAFYVAEEYHQHFAERNPNYPYIVEVDAPKVAALEKQFPNLLARTAAR